MGLLGFCIFWPRVVYQYIPKVRTAMSTETMTSLFMLTMGSEEKIDTTEYTEQTVQDVVVSSLLLVIFTVFRDLHRQHPKNLS